MSNRGVKAVCGLGLATFGGILYFTYKQTLIGKLKDKIPELQTNK